MPWLIGFFSKPWDFDSRLGAAGHVSSTAYFLNFLEDTERRFKTNLTLNLIIRFNLRLGLLDMECEFNHTPYKRKLENYSGHEHLTTSKQPRKYSEDTFKMEFGRTRRRLHKYSEACSTQPWRARELVRPEATGLRTWCTYSRIRDGTWPTPYTNCNYSYRSRTSRNRRTLPE
jgi:hypothetical protein